MPAPAESPATLEQQLDERLLEFERLDEAWPHGEGAVERAEIGRRREEALSDFANLQYRIITAQAETLADAAAQLRRLAVMANERPTAHALLAPPSARRLVASVLAVVERVVDGTAGPS